MTVAHLDVLKEYVLGRDAYLSTEEISPTLAAQRVVCHVHYAVVHVDVRCGIDVNAITVWCLDAAVVRVEDGCLRDGYVIAVLKVKCPIWAVSEGPTGG